MAQSAELIVSCRDHAECRRTIERLEQMNDGVIVVVGLHDVVAPCRELTALLSVWERGAPTQATIDAARKVRDVALLASESTIP